MQTNKLEKGKKRLCEQCSTKWYDLSKKPIICPVCNQEFEENDFNLGNIASSLLSNKNTQETNEKTNQLESQDDLSHLESEDETEIISLEEAEDETS